MRLRLLILISLLALAAPATATARRHGHRHRSALRVVLAGVHGTRRPHVRVTGPHGFRRTLRRSLTIAGLRPGRYRISAPPFAVNDGTDYSSPRKLVVELRAGRRRTARLRYGNVISRRTRVAPAPPQQVLGAAGDPSGLLLAQTAHVAVGQILYYPISQRFPDGLLSRVTSVSRGGGHVRVGLVAASLADAFPQINTAVVLPITPPRGAGANRADFAGIDSGPSAHIAAINVSLINGSFQCGTAAGSPPSLSFPLSLDPTLDASISKPLGGSLSAHFVVGVTGTAGLQLSAPAGTGCQYSPPGLGPFPIGAIPIGPIEIPVTAELKGQAALSLAGALTASASVSESVTAGFSYADGSLSPVSSASPSGSASISYGGGSFTIGPKLVISAGFGEAFSAQVSAGLYDNLKGSSASSWQLGLLLDIQAALQATGIGKLSVPVYQHFFGLTSYGVPKS